MADEKQVLQTIKSILQLANSNFPGGGEVTISVSGRNNGSIKLPWYTLSKLLKSETDLVS